MTVDDSLSSGDEDEALEDYELPPDAGESSPQNISVTVEGQVSYKWAEPVEKKAELMNKRLLSDTSLEAFYDFAHEVGSAEKEREKMEGARLEGAVYEEVKAKSDAQPSNSDWTKESTYDVYT